MTNDENQLKFIKQYFDDVSRIDLKGHNFNVERFLLLKAAEECSELSHALLRFYFSKLSKSSDLFWDVISELADIYNTFDLLGSVDVNYNDKSLLNIAKNTKKMIKYSKDHDMELTKFIGSKPIEEFDEAYKYVNSCPPFYHPYCMVSFELNNFDLHITYVMDAYLPDRLRLFYKLRDMLRKEEISFKLTKTKADFSSSINPEAVIYLVEAQGMNKLIPSLLAGRMWKPHITFKNSELADFVKPELTKDDFTIDVKVGFMPIEMKGSVSIIERFEFLVQTARLMEDD